MLHSIVICTAIFHNIDIGATHSQKENQDTKLDLNKVIDLFSISLISFIRIISIKQKIDYIFTLEITSFRTL